MTDEKVKSALVGAITALLQGNKVVQQMFEDFGVDVAEIQNIPIEFADLKVSAKTRNGKVYLNKHLLDDDDFKDDIHYIVHEATHWLQQLHGDARKYKKDDTDDYLDLPAEIEAFKYQVQFMKDFQDDELAEQYVDDLLEFHELEGEEKSFKKSELMGE